MKKVSDILALGWLLFAIAMIFNYLGGESFYSKAVGFIGISIIGIVESYYLFESWRR